VKGKLETRPLEKKERRTGTVIRWKPDLEVFTDINIPSESFRITMKRQAVVNPGIKFVLRLEQEKNKFETEEFLYEHDISDYVTECAEGAAVTPPVIWHLETIDYPELYEASCQGNQYETYTDASGQCGDYAHINSVDFDKNNNAVIVSFRNIGLVSFDYTTKEINWMIGTNRNDIAGVTADKMPKFQHCARVMEDGSLIVFDNSGCLEDYSRIQRFWIDSEKKQLTDYKEYLGNMPRSPYMGCIQLVDEDTETYLISYGGDFSEMALEEYDFSNGKRTFKLVFDMGHDLYAFSAGPQKVRWHGY
jgi:hypothetical protein